VAGVPFSVVFATIGRTFRGEASLIEYVDLALVGLMLGLGVALLRRAPIAYSVYFWTVMLVNLSQGRLFQPIASQGRYTVALFPAFWFLGQLGKDPRLHRLILYPSLALWIFLAGQYMMWGWVG
jgi:hypothetical protein